MRIGLVQTGAIGDIVIALPIACYYLDQGCEVFWPVDNRFIDFFSEAEPRINFLPVDAQQHGANTLDYFLKEPYVLLNKFSCDNIFTLYSYLTGIDLGHHRLARSLKFDEYKYAVAGVPFSEKWKLKINRNSERENKLFELLDIKGDYIVVHEEGGAGSDFKFNIELHDSIVESHQIIKIASLTSSPFDWIPIFEGAKQIAMIDCLHANVIDQLNIKVPKSLYLRSDVNFTPVFAVGWDFK